MKVAGDVQVTMVIRGMCPRHRLPISLLRPDHCSPARAERHQATPMPSWRRWHWDLRARKSDYHRDVCPAAEMLSHLLEGRPSSSAMHSVKGTQKVLGWDAAQRPAREAWAAELTVGNSPGMSPHFFIEYVKYTTEYVTKVIYLYKNIA